MHLNIFNFTLLLALAGPLLLAQAASKARNGRQEKKTPITLEEVLGNAFGARGFGGSWATDDTIRVISGNNILDINLLTNTNTSLVDSKVFEDKYGQQALSFTLSADKNFLMVEHNKTSLWRHSYLAKYDLLNISSGNFSSIQPSELGNEDPQQLLQLAQLSPTGHAVAFVFQNNIYYKKSFEATSEKITLDGTPDIFNGISDWVYEEEMFGSPVAMWFSKNSSNLAFVKFNDKNVTDYQWPLYGEPGVRETVYPIYEPLKYPKAGCDNPEVSLHLVNLENTPIVINITYPPGQDMNLQYYIATVTWASDSDLIVETLNRAQNQAVWNYCNSEGCREVHSQSQTSEPIGWIDAHRPTVSKDGSKFLTLQPVAQSSDSGKSYTHIVSVSTASSSKASTTLTAGAFSVDSILGWDEQSNKIYFSGSGFYPEMSNVSTNHPSERQVYSVEATATNAIPTCVSCDIKTGADEVCKRHSFSFSSNFQFYTHSCQGPNVPEITTKWTSNNSVVKMWTDNSALREQLEKKLLPITRDLEVDIDGGFKAKVRLYLPPDFNENQKYPLFIDVYAGPESMKINDDYKVDWGTYLSSSKGIIYGYIDGRGSGRQSTELKFSLYRKLGSVEIEDQISVTRNLVETQKYIDANKTAIWGWSYGGYATAMVLGMDLNNTFKCGISVAPVTSWLYYDTIYTERYMGLPTDADNWAGYEAGSVMNHIDNFKSKQFLLIHGNADDNVHYQQSMMLARSLEQNDVLFNQLSYPEENHGINGPGMRRHLYHSIEHFLTRDCFSDETTGKDTNSSPSFTMSFYLIFVALSVNKLCS